MRIRVQYSKTGAMRFTGHLDLYKAWERLIRRANVRLAYTQGFNPHPRINLSHALPLGFTSECELIDILLEEPSPIDDLRNAFIDAAPPGISIHTLRELEVGAPTLQSIIDAAVYKVILLEHVDNLPQRIDSLLSMEKIERIRRGKPYDLRPLILNLEIEPEDPEHQTLRMQLTCRESATGRPDEVLDALGIHAYDSLVHRLSFLETISASQS